MGSVGANQNNGSGSNKIEGDAKTVTLKMKTDTFGEYTQKEVTASIQDTSQFDAIKTGELARSAEREYDKFISDLYRESVQNYNSTENQLIDFERHAEIAKEGKFSKIDDVPIFRRANPNMENPRMEVIKGTGYVTKFDGNTYYLQKLESGKGFAITVDGVLAGKFKSLAKAKEALPEVAQKIAGVRKNGSVERIKKEVQYVNRNRGKVSERLFKKFQNDNSK